MTQRERGAVNAMWLVFVIVLFLGAVGASFVQSQDVTKLRATIAEMKATEDASAKRLQEKVDAMQALTKVVGFSPDKGSVSSPATAQAKIDELRTRYPNDIGQADTTLENMCDRLKAIAEKWERVAGEATQSAATELAARTAAEAARDTANHSVQEQLDNVNRDLGDQRNLLTQAQTQAEARAADFQRQIDDATVQKNEAEAAHQKLLSASKAETTSAKARVGELADKVRIGGTDERPMEPDGKIISVGKNTGLVFIDIGSRDLLRAGVKFDVFRYAKGGEMVRKGTIEVRETSTDHSTGGILTELNKLDPIAAGDVIANPHFTRNHTRVFVLLGNFPAYGREFLAQRLRDLGCEVEDKVTAHTDFLVLGEKGSEEGAPELTEDPNYKLAHDTGVQTMKLSDIERFIRP